MRQRGALHCQWLPALLDIAPESFGAYLLQKWMTDDSTMGHPVPRYIWLVVGCGAAAAAANVMSACGACCRSLWLLSWSATISETLLFWQIVLAVLLFYNPAAVDTEVCAADDIACLQQVDSLFKDPSTHAGVMVAVVCGVQAVALGLLVCFRSSTYRQQARGQIERAVAAALARHQQTTHAHVHAPRGAASTMRTTLLHTDPES